ncbi:WD40 repeat [Nonomuraea solani]|uniref:WD40 repeat n=1 Tax=Nonomuraea solani TaxID=1144553 RepID=A0A1H6ESR2_9ACTN|nr:WD40 repeat domain-containing protein [Nonomuraea solani]SEG99995.1 WD40 repeat [Nonomuraea solani]
MAGAIPGTAGWIERPEVVDRLVTALTSGESGLVVVVPEVAGVEGLGLTAAAAAAVRRPEVVERFPEGIGWVSSGGAHPEEWAEELGRVLEHLNGEELEPYSWMGRLDPLELAHDEAAVYRLLQEEIFKPSARLMVIDGLAHAGMVVSLAFAMPGCTWLVTARAAEADLEFAITVPVGPMPPSESAALLRRDLPALDEGTAGRLAAPTGGWPLALGLIHGTLASQVVTGEAATEAASRLAARLPSGVDLTDPASRAVLIGAIVDHAVDWLRMVDPAAAERFLRLGVFEAGEAVPIGVAAMMWSAGESTTGGRIGALIARLEGMSLVRRRTDHPVLLLATAVSARVRELLGPEGLERARQALIDGSPSQTPDGWGDLPGTGEWMLRNLARLYAEAGDRELLEELVCDASWLSMRLQQSGLTATLSDLTRALHPPKTTPTETSPTETSPAVTSPAVTSPGVISPAVTSPGVISPAVSSSAPTGPAVVSPAEAGPAVTGPAVVGPVATTVVIGPAVTDPPGSGPALARSAVVGPTTDVDSPTVSFADPLIGSLPEHSAGSSADFAGMRLGQVEVVGRILAGSSHLLEPAREQGLNLLPTLAARLNAAPGKGEEARRWLEELGEPWLESRWTAPDLQHPALLRTHHSRSERMTDLAMAPDGSWVAAGGDQGRVMRWQADGTGMPALLGHEGRVTAVAVAPGGDWLATASWDGTVRLWERDGKPRAVLDDLPDDPNTLAIAPDGTWLVAGGEGFLAFWEADGTLRALVEAGTYDRVAIAPDGTWLAAVGGEVAELWHPDGTRKATIVTNHDRDDDTDLATDDGTDDVEDGGADMVAIAPSGEWLALMSGHGTILLVNADGTPRGELDGVFAHGKGLAIAPDGTWLAVSDIDENIAIMGLDGSVRARFPAHTVDVSGLVIMPDGRRLVSAGDRTVRVWDVGVAPRAGPGEPRDRRRTLSSVAVADDGSYLATAGPGGLTLWNPDGSVREQGPDDWMWSVAIAPGGRFLITGDTEARIRLFDPDGTVRWTKQTPQAGALMHAPSAAIAPDGTWMAVAVANTVRIQTPDGPGTTVLGPYAEEVTAVAIAPDSSWLAVSAGSDLRLWTREGRPMGPGLDTEGHAESLTIAPGGRHLAAATLFGSIELFDLRGDEVGECAARFGPDEWLTGVAFSPDGARLVTTTKQGCLQVWDVETRTCESAILVDGDLHDCAWFPDGSGVCAVGAAGLFGFTYHL